MQEAADNRQLSTQICSPGKSNTTRKREAVVAGGCSSEETAGNKNHGDALDSGAGVDFKRRILLLFLRRPEAGPDGRQASAKTVDLRMRSGARATCQKRLA
jgi:hypothetical protein